MSHPLGVSLLDVRATVRSLRQRPSFTLAAVTTLALGIGATTAVFSVVNALLVRPLPYRDPTRIAAIWPEHYLANRELAFLRSRAAGLSQVAAWSPGWLMTLVGTDVPRQLTAARLSGNAFELLGASAMVGRAFGIEAERAGSDGVAVLSDRAWRSIWGRDPAIVGRSIVMNGRPYTVVGVMPSTFELFDTKTDLWIPLTMDPDEFTWRAETAQLFGRLAPGATLDATAAEFRVLAGQMRVLFGHPADWDRDARMADLKQSFLGGARPTLGLLLGAVAFLLLIAIANVANLLVIRASERRQELAVRTALGASGGRIARLLVIESLAIGAVGGLAGIALAFLAMRAIRGLLPSDLLRVGEIRVDFPVLALAVVVTVGAALAFSLAPVVHTHRGLSAPAARLARGWNRTGEMTRRALVAVEVGLAIVLLSGAALMTRTMMALSAVDPGLRTDHLLTARVQPTGGTADRLDAFWRDALERVGHIPGVVAVGTILHLPTSGRSWDADIDVEGRPLPAGASRPRASWQSVSDGLFAAAGIPVVEGRGFDRSDRAGGLRVVVVNTAFAARLFPGRSPIGVRINGGYATGAEWATIVGVVGGVRHDSLNAAPAPGIYVPFAQKPVWATSLVVRTSGKPEALAAAVRERIWSIDRTVPVTEMRSMDDLLSGSLQRPRMILTLIALFAVVGLVLGAVGIYGVVAFGVRQRRRELSIRSALGAGRAALAGSVIGAGLRSAAAGIAAGLPVALGLSMLLRRFVFGVPPTDPPTFIAVVLMVLAIAGLASWLPARRAVGVDLATVLRE